MSSSSPLATTIFSPTHESSAIKLTRIDFTKTTPPLPEFAGLHAVVLDNVLTPAECRNMLAAAEVASGGQCANGIWERAMINVGNGVQRLATDVRNCDRIIWDDQSIIDTVWQRCAPHVPEIHELDGADKSNARILGNGPLKRKEKYRLTRPNERMRVLKYIGGEYFQIHCDGHYATPGGEERSYYTLQLYLNGRSDEEDSTDTTTPNNLNSNSSENGNVDSESETTFPSLLDGPNLLVGGATTFHGEDLAREVNVEPRAGRVLIFQQKWLWHSGQEVESGLKITVRTDLMYRKVGDEAK